MVLKNRPEALFFMSSMIAASLYGYSLSKGWDLAAGFALILIFINFKAGRAYSLKRQALMVFAVHFAFMQAASLWFRNIEALGWADIAGLAPQIWLMIAASIVILACSLSVVGLFWLVYFKFTQSHINENPALTVYHWATFMTLAEIIRALAFAFIVKGEGMSVEPFWNLYSSGLILSEGPFAILGRGLGLWGTSFFVYFFTACLGHVVLSRKARTLLPIVTPSLTLLLIVVIMSFVSFGGSTTKDFRVVGIAQQSGQSDYLRSLPDKLPVEDNLPVIVALPEYSNLLHPFTNTTGFSLNYDGRYELPDKLSKNVYIAGTEDETFEGKRYAEIYVVNSKLEKIKRQSKSFLIPGGEYIPSWIHYALGKFDKSSVVSFLSTRGRQVISDKLEPDTKDNLAKYIGTGACSILLTPYKYQTAVSQGALVLTSNVSFEQFNDAPEYKLYAGRFARFISMSLERPLVIGARDGAAEIYDESGKLLDSSYDTASSRVSVKDNRTIYSILGDKVILLFLLVPSLIARMSWKKPRE